MARKWYLRIQYKEDESEYLWKTPEALDLSFLGAFVEVIDLPQVVRPQKALSYEPVLKHDKTGIPYASMQSVISYRPSFESFCEEGHNHSERIVNDAPIYERLVVRYAWAIKFFTQDELEQFLVDYEPDVEYLMFVNDYGFFISHGAWLRMLEKGMKEDDQFGS